MEFLPVLLKLALLLFGTGLAVFLWDVDISAAEVVLAVTCIGSAFYIFLAVVAMIWKDCPFQTPLFVLPPKLLVWTKGIAALTKLRLKHGLKRRSVVLQYLAEPAEECATQEAINSFMQLSNPAFWRDAPLFTPLPPNDTSASAGLWTLENSTSFSAATAVAAVFPEFQWPSYQSSLTALFRLRDTHIKCFQRPKLNKSTRLKALQTAAAYYVLYHTQLVWCASRGFQVEKMPSFLPSDLFFDHKEEWGSDSLFEYLLHVKDRSESVTSARFLAYIAPYWFCGDSDAQVRVRPTRLGIVYQLVQALKDSNELNLASMTDCLLCVGATIGFPLHPEDLIRVNKRCVRSRSRVDSEIDSG